MVVVHKDVSRDTVRFKGCSQVQGMRSGSRDAVRFKDSVRMMWSNVRECPAQYLTVQYQYHAVHVCASSAQHRT